MKIAVIGTGYVGLVTATCLAESGNDVIGIDKDATQDRHAARRQAADLRARLARTGSAQSPRWPAAYSRPIWRKASLPARIIFLAVGTPQSAEGSADLRARCGRSPTPSPHLESQSEGTPGKIVIVKSTVPVGTNRALAERLDKAGCPSGVEVASNPEFLKEGAAIDDFMKPDRVVVGVRRPEVGRGRSRDCTRRSCAPSGRSWSCRPNRPR